MSEKMSKKQTKALKEHFEESSNIGASRKAAIKRIIKLHGSEAAGVIKEKVFIKSSSIRLNWITAGGYCLGRIYEIAGKYSSGKTTISLDAIANAQKQFPDKFCFFIDAEQSFDPVWAAKFGVDVDRLDVFDPPNTQAAFDEVRELMMSGAYSLGVIDSVAALISAEEILTDTAGAKDRMGASAGAISIGLKKLIRPAKQSQTCLILLNQMRDNLNPFSGGKPLIPGGNALKHYCSCRMQVSVVNGSEEKDENDDVTGHTIKIFVEKNKLGFPKRKTELRLSFTKAFDTDAELFKLARENDIVVRHKKQFWFKNNSICKSSEEFLRLMKKKPKFRSRLYEAVDKNFKREQKSASQEEFEVLAKDIPEQVEQKDGVAMIESDI